MSEQEFRRDYLRVINEQPPEQCPNCGAALQIHCGYNRPYRRHGWFVYGECESRWHPEHGLNISRLCEVRRERDEARKALRLLADEVDAGRRDCQCGDLNCQHVAMTDGLLAAIYECCVAARAAAKGGEDE